MKIVAAISLALWLVAPSMASAGTFPIPDENPIATVSIPEAWSPKPYDGGVEATSPDGDVYVAVESVAAKDVGPATEDGIHWFTKQGVDIDAKSIKTQDIKVNGMEAFDVEMLGKDKDGPTQVSMTLVKTNANDKFLMLYFWGSEAGEKANATALTAIASSLQATK